MTRVSVSIFALLLGMIAACSSAETSESSASVICDITQCESAAPGAPTLSTDGTLAGPICEDGTVARTDCAPDSTGGCAWTIVKCPQTYVDPPVLCTDCDGEAPALPSHICTDGTVAGPTCVATSFGACEWIITECPDPQPTDCSNSDCPTGQHCETDCHPCDAPDPKTPCDSFTCQSTCVYD